MRLLQSTPDGKVKALLPADEIARLGLQEKLGDEPDKKLTADDAAHVLGVFSAREVAQVCASLIRLRKSEPGEEVKSRAGRTIAYLNASALSSYTADELLDEGVTLQYVERVQKHRRALDASRIDGYGKVARDLTVERLDVDSIREGGH